MIERRRRERRRPTRRKFNLKKFLRDYPIVSAAAITLLVGIASGYFLGRGSILQYYPTQGTLRPAIAKNKVITTSVPAVAVSAVPPKRFPQVLFQGEGMIPVERFLQPKTASKKFPKPRIVFVIDDVGHNKRYADMLFSMNQPVTLAILPGVAYSKYFAEEAKRRGIETILHLPLEPEDQEDPGPGTITVNMDANEIKDTLKKDIASVPGVIGVNNHMGSRATRDRGLMYLILKELRREDLFFLDSMTHPDSVAHDVAYAVGLPSLKRDVFLDNEDDFNYVTERINEVAQVAKQTGQAIAIGHVRKNTLSAIKQAIPRLEKEGFELSTLKSLA